MIFDYETIYFDYNGRTWLVEMWKGQYGINTGCELGIYYADEIIPPDKYPTTHFNAVDLKDMPELSLSLSKASKTSNEFQELASLYHKHWWLAFFKMGLFTNPQDLLVNTAIRFKSYPMLRRFVESFEETLPDTPYRINGLTIYFAFHTSKRSYSLIRKIIRRLALISCCLYCKWFHYITRPFHRSGDKLLYLYYYLPFVIRIIIKAKK